MAVSIRPFTERDLDQTFCWISDADLRRAMDYGGPVTRKEHKSWFERVSGQYLFAVEVDERHVGNCCLKNYDKAAGRAEVWIYIGDKEDRGKGYGAEALRLLLEYGFGTLGLNRVFLYALGFNRDAIAFYETVGFKREGCFRQHFAADGGYCDAVYLGMLRTEWLELRGKGK